MYRDKWLAHHGVKGMKWGVRRYQPYGHGGYNPKNGGVKAGQLAGSSSGKNSKTKRALKIAAGVAGAAALAGGTAYLIKSGKGAQAVNAIRNSKFGTKVSGVAGKIKGSKFGTKVSGAAGKIKGKAAGLKGKLKNVGRKKVNLTHPGRAAAGVSNGTFTVNKSGISLAQEANRINGAGRYTGVTRVATPAGGFRGVSANRRAAVSGNPFSGAASGGTIGAIRTMGDHSGGMRAVRSATRGSGIRNAASRAKAKLAAIDKKTAAKAGLAAAGSIGAVAGASALTAHQIKKRANKKK